MTQNDKDERIKHLTEQMEAARIEMVQSDAKASKCSKMGLVFETTYPSDYASYMEANARYNTLEAERQSVIDEPVDDEPIGGEYVEEGE